MTSKEAAEAIIEAQSAALNTGDARIALHLNRFAQEMLDAYEASLMAFVRELEAAKSFTGTAVAKQLRKRMSEARKAAEQ